MSKSKSKSMNVGAPQATTADSYSALPPGHPALGDPATEGLDDLDPPASLATENEGHDEDELPADTHNYEQRPQHAVHKLDPLTRDYLAKGVDSFRRVPNLKLSEGFRARLETFRQLLSECVRRGVKGEVRQIATVVSVLGVDGAGKVDAIVFLRQLMGQVMWAGSIDIAKLRRPKPGRDEQREAPWGMADMSDHADAIQGFVGPDTNPRATMTEDDVYGALAEVNGLLTTIADSLCDTDGDREFLNLHSGLSYLDEPVADPMAPNGVRWEPVYELERAVDIQLVKNNEARQRRERENATRRAGALAKLAELYGA